MFGLHLGILFVKTGGISSSTQILPVDSNWLLGKSCPQYQCSEIWDRRVSRRGRPWLYGNLPNSCDFFSSWVANRQIHFTQRTQKAETIYRLASALQTSHIAEVDPSLLALFTQREFITVNTLVSSGALMLESISLDDDFWDSYVTSKRKLVHDMEQLTFLLTDGKLPSCFWTLVQQYGKVLSTLMNEDKTIVLSPDNFKRIGWFHSSLIYFTDLPKMDKATVVNPKFDFTFARTQYALNSPNYLVVDDVLSAKALDALVRFTLESTIWFEEKKAGYFGAYFYDGFANPILEQLVHELRTGFPDIIGDLPLTQQWAYKYEQNASMKQDVIGIPYHADDALVNVNFWIIPDDANSDPTGGGMDLILKEPDQFDIKKHNTIEPSLIFAQGGYANAPRLKIPYRQNRMIMFTSTLIHASDKPDFKPGYASRRINLTLLFGKALKRCRSADSQQCTV